MRKILPLPLLISFMVMILAAGITGVALANIEKLRRVGAKPDFHQALPENVALSSKEASRSCARPTAGQLAMCQMVEQQILDSTLRIEMQAWLEVAGGSREPGTRSFAKATGNGHATIRDGRYLVTHNHFGIPLPALESGEAFVFGTVTIYTASGEEVAIALNENPFTVNAIDQETLVFDFGTVDGQGAFAAMGLPSATFKCWEELTLQPGLEVAQVDWDGFEAFVKWVTIEEVITDGGPARLILSGGLAPGASGGGVFYMGQHIANNWQLVEFINEDGQVFNQVNTAALNSPLVMALGA